jgi:hypothetical protein
MDRKFGWATGYYASSVSMKMIPVVRKYIQNQKEHHKLKTWSQEEQQYQRMIMRVYEPFRWDRRHQ